MKPDGSNESLWIHVHKIYDDVCLFVFFSSVNLKAKKESGGDGGRGGGGSDTLLTNFRIITSSSSEPRPINTSYFFLIEREDRLAALLLANS